MTEQTNKPSEKIANRPQPVTSPGDTIALAIILAALIQRNNWTKPGDIAHAASKAKEYLAALNG